VQIPNLTRNMTAQRFPDPANAGFMQQIERAIFDLRRGLPVMVHDTDTIRLVAPVEGITAALFSEMQSAARDAIHLLLTGQRLAHMGLAQPLDAASIALQPEDTHKDAIRWAADPATAWPASGTTTPATLGERAGLALLRRGLLLPAAVCIDPNDSFAHTFKARVASGEILQVSATDVFAHCQSTSPLQRISEAAVPLEAAADARFVVFREAGLVREHVAVLIGEAAHWPAPVPVRLHSACLTGDLFGSLRCDCGSQLKASVAEIGRRGGGVLLYLDQEGRGTGLANKMRAYQIQDDGLDTVDADRALGFGKDERDYTAARAMLAQLSITEINLLTNNPAKLEAMDQDPIRVLARSGVYGRLTKENQRYLATKSKRSGHWLDDLLADPYISKDPTGSQ
jgi:GTP cyclohydrolase II